MGEGISERLACELWRKNVMGLTRPELAELTGYSRAAIQNFERGVNISTGAKVKPREMQRYRMVCACVMAGLTFDWRTLTLDPRPLTKAVLSSRLQPEEVD